MRKTERERERERDRKTERHRFTKVPLQASFSQKFLSIQTKDAM